MILIGLRDPYDSGCLTHIVTIIMQCCQTKAIETL